MTSAIFANDIVPRLPVVLELAQAAPNSAGSIVTLDAPRISDYWVTATLQSGGTIVFDGYAPDEATRQALQQFQGADIQWLKLGSGAPAGYRPAVDYCLSALALMSEGRFSLRDNVVTITGVARTAADYETLRTAILNAAPQGLVMARSDVVAPKIQRFEWSATKSPSGAIVLAGSAPSPEVEAELLAAAGPTATHTMAFASGEPDDFLASARTGIEQLQWLSEGRVAYDGSGWTVTGTPSSATAQSAIEASFADNSLAAAGWSIAMAQPAAAPQPTVIAEPVIADPSPASPPPAAVDPGYTFSASRANGNTVLSGQLPTDAAMQSFATLTSGNIEAVTIATGAPFDFLADAEVGLRALSRLESGRLDFSAGKWTLSGTAPNPDTQTSIASAIAATSDPALWSSSVDVASVTPAVPVRTSSNAVADVGICRETLAEFSARNAILFRSGAAVITPESVPALDELATDLAACPDAVIHVEGHTDTDGDERQNLALSVARAESVISALIERQVQPERLYAVGYGESNPIAPNDTPDGKRLNRRIVVTVLDEHY